MYGPGHDSWSGFPILWARTEKVCIVHDLGVYGLFLGHRLPMVLLGLLAGLQLLSYKWFHRKSGKFRFEGCSRNAISRIATYSRAAVLFLPGV
jgi:hypothetical protein